MLQLELKLNLKNHCIASEIKKLYNESVSTYFKETRKSSSYSETTVEETIELLKNALEKLDLPGLRSSYPALAGKTDSHVVLGVNDDFDLYISIDNKLIELLFSQ